MWSPSGAAPTSAARCGSTAGRSVGLTAAIGLDVVCARIVPLARAACPRPCSAAARWRRSPPIGEGREPEVIIVNAHLSPGAAAQSGKGLERQGAGPHRADSGDLRRTRAHPGRPAAGRAGASHLSALAPGAKLDPSGAPTRRLRLSGRSRRNPDRNRPAPDRRTHRRRSSKELEEVKRTRGLHRRRAGGCRIRSWRWWATPMPASRPCSTG